jgi:hypothetical protein
VHQEAQAPTATTAPGEAAQTGHPSTSEVSTPDADTGQPATDSAADLWIVQPAIAETGDGGAPVPAHVGGLLADL